LSDADFYACFDLIQLTSSQDYKKATAGWNPREKKKEMKLLDLKYFMVKHGNQVEGFVSFMPTREDGYPVIYCYEIHLSATLRGYATPFIFCDGALRPLSFVFTVHIAFQALILDRTGLATALMRLLEGIAAALPGTAKMMLTCFTNNRRALQFYHKLGYSQDEYSPQPRVLRDGTRVESEYIILSKAVSSL
jgi:N-alpha-acetyltransferase 40